MHRLLAALALVAASVSQVTFAASARPAAAASAVRPDSTRVGEAEEAFDSRAAALAVLEDVWCAASGAEHPSELCRRGLPGAAANLVACAAVDARPCGDSRGAAVARVAARLRARRGVWRRGELESALAALVALQQWPEPSVAGGCHSAPGQLLRSAGSHQVTARTPYDSGPPGRTALPQATATQLTQPPAPPPTVHGLAKLGTFASLPHRSAHGAHRVATLALEVNTARRPDALQTAARVDAHWLTEWPKERDALDVLFAVTGGLNGTWVNSANWMGEPVPVVCSRFGVICNATTGRVVELRLGSNGLKGSLPPLKPLSVLRVLNVSDNFLSNLWAETFSGTTELQRM